jgi:hypothetical protein
MQSVKLTIRGSFWDSQIYSGELLLLDDNGAINHIDWGRAIDLIAENNESVQTALRVAFSDSDLFYNPKVRKILLDPQIAKPIISQLTSLSTSDFEADNIIWKSFWRQEESPFDFMPLDTEVYYNRIFAGGDEGLFSFPRGVRSHHKNSLDKHHDASFFQIKASDNYTAIAGAGGKDGLFEFDFKKNSEDALEKEKILSPRPCNACEWSFQSVIGWTSEAAFFANFTEHTERGSNKKIRVFDKILDAKDAFGSSDDLGAKSFVWGAREKVYKLTGDGIEVSNYNKQPKKPTKNKPDQNKLFGAHGKIQHDLDASKVVATGTAPFGTVIELLDSLVVVRSDGATDIFPEAPVHWRVFPRSEHYSNQLHIIYEDRLEIISFVHDYFVDQKSKLAGFSRGLRNDDIEHKFSNERLFV